MDFTNKTYIEFLNEVYDEPIIRLLFSIIAFGVGILSVVLNLLALIAISRIRGSLPVNIRLVCLLVAFDLFVSVVVIIETSFSFDYHSLEQNITRKYEINQQPLSSYHPCMAIILHVMRYMGYNGTLLSLTALATDLYVAIMYPLNYSSLMRKDRVNFIIVFVFVIASLFGSCELYFPFVSTNQGPRMYRRNYCFVRWQSHMKSSIVTFGLLLISVVVVSVVYTSVFYQIRNFHKNGVRYAHYQNKNILTSNNVNATARNGHVILRESSNSSSLKKNQRGLTTTLVLLLVFLCCFLPNFFTELYLMIIADRQIFVYRNDITLTGILMNLPLICSALDPILYSYRLKDIQLSYLKLFCCHDERKPTLPPVVAGRARAHPTVPVYLPIHRRSVACTSPNSNLKQSMPWSQRLANATGIYIERIRKISNRSSGTVTLSHKRTPVSAPPFNEIMDYESKNDGHQSAELLKNPYYTIPNEFLMVSANFISPPKMVLSTWHFANRSLQQSWLKDDVQVHEFIARKLSNSADYNHKLSNFSSFEYGICSGHSDSIDSANTNSTSTAGSFNQNRSQSYDYCHEKAMRMKTKIKNKSNKL